MTRYLAPVAFALFAAASSVHAAHPQLTDDTGTQGAANGELELGFSWTRDGADRLFAFQPQLSYGLAATLDLIVQPSWLDASVPYFGSSRGFGDTLVDVKWRFHEDGPLSLAVRGGATFATSQNGLGLPKGKADVHAQLIATLDAAPFTLDANVGYNRLPPIAGARTNLLRASASVVYAASERLALVADTAFVSNPVAARSTWPGVLLCGAIYTLPGGIDVDVGYQVRLNHAAPAQQWLLGVTYRWGS